MDFIPDDTPELQAWRAEVRSFLEEALPGGMIFDYDYDEDEGSWTKYLSFWRRVGEKGWISLTWPTEYYGLGRSAIEKWILQEEFIKYGAPTYPAVGLSIVSPLLRLGTREQRLKHLKGIADATILWGEGYSEPGAGSDLAALTTRATRQGEDWILNGQKTLGTAAHKCQWMFVLARTDPEAKPHSSLTCFLVPLDAPGVSMTPLHNIAGGQQNHTFFDNVRLTPDHILGDVNQAWSQIWFGMGGEKLDRAGPAADAWQLRIMTMLNQVITYCRETERDGRRLSDDPVIRLQLAELILGVEALKVDAYEVYSRAMSANMEPGRPATMNLVHAYWKELWPRLAQTCTEIVGPMAQLYGGPWAKLDGRVQHYYRASFGNHAGGTSQLKRMAFATRGLGLPR